MAYPYKQGQLGLLCRGAYLESDLAAIFASLSCAGSGLLSSVEEAQAEADKVRLSLLRSRVLFIDQQLLKASKAIRNHQKTATPLDTMADSGSGG